MTLSEEQMDTNEALLIQSMRIYDVLMLLAFEQNPKAAEQLAATHEAGYVVGQYPYLLGRVGEDTEQQGQ